MTATAATTEMTVIVIHNAGTSFGASASPVPEIGKSDAPPAPPAVAPRPGLHEAPRPRRHGESTSRLFEPGSGRLGLNQVTPVDCAGATVQGGASRPRRPWAAGRSSPKPHGGAGSRDTGLTDRPAEAQRRLNGSRPTLPGTTASSGRSHCVPAGVASWLERTEAIVRDMGDGVDESEVPTTAPRTFADAPCGDGAAGSPWRACLRRPSASG